MPCEQGFFACGPRKQYKVYHGDLLRSGGIFLFAGLVSVATYAAMQRSTTNPSLTNLYDSLCSEENFIDPPLCPPNYIQNFLQTCQYAIQNGTQSLYSTLVTTSTFPSRLPIMTEDSAMIVSNACRFPMPTVPGYDSCVITHVLTCAAKLWSSFALYYRENEALSMSRQDLTSVINSMFTTVLLMGTLAALSFLSFRVWKNYKAEVESSADLYQPMTAGMKGAR